MDRKTAADAVNAVFDHSIENGDVISIYEIAKFIGQFAQAMERHPQDEDETATPCCFSSLGYRALKQLPFDLKFPLELYYWEEETVAVIAYHTEKSTLAVKTDLRRGKHEICHIIHELLLLELSRIPRHQATCSCCQKIWDRIWQIIAGT